LDDTREPGKGFLTGADQEDGFEDVKKLKLVCLTPILEAVGQLSQTPQGVKRVAEQRCEGFQIQYSSTQQDIVFTSFDHE